MKKLLPIKKVLMFSGGRTSAKMLFDLMELYGDSFHRQWEVIFCNTGKENNKTLEFVDRVSVNWRVNITWLEYSSTFASKIPSGVFPTKKRNDNLEKLKYENKITNWFKLVNFKTASRKGEPFDDFLNQCQTLPNVVNRSCSSRLKARTAMWYLFYNGIKKYHCAIGIRKDEAHRAIQILATCESFTYPVFPLIESNQTEKDIINFWKKQTFDLELEQHEGNCDLCFLKARWKRISIIRKEPIRAFWWIEKENEFKSKTKTTGGNFILNESYQSMLNDASHPELNLDTTAQDIPCSCAEKGFEKEEE